MITELTCIGCPLGCQITAESENGKILSVSGQSCAIGKRYAKEELTHPTRMVTSLMETVGGGTPLSVKTSTPIGKEKIFECLAEIRRTKAQLPVHIGDILIRNVCGTDTDIVATKELY